MLLSLEMHEVQRNYDILMYIGLSQVIAVTCEINTVRFRSIMILHTAVVRLTFGR